MLPSGQDLTYFLEIAREGNLTRAASRLNISQPSLSLAMQRLEGEVGTSLFIRSRQGVRLTKAGEKLFAEGHRLMNYWTELRGQTLSAMNEVQGRFRLGCHVSVARYALPQFIPQLMSDHPRLEIALLHELSRVITQKVVQLELDLGIVVNPIPHPDLIMKKLTTDVVTLWRSEDCLSEDVLILEPSLRQTQSLLSKLKQRFARVIESSSLEVVSALAECGAGTAILPARVAHASLKAVKGAPSFQDEIYLVYRIENKKVRALNALSDAIQKGFSRGERAVPTPARSGK